MPRYPRRLPPPGSPAPPPSFVPGQPVRVAIPWSIQREMWKQKAARSIRPRTSQKRQFRLAPRNVAIQEIQRPAKIPAKPGRVVIAPALLDTMAGPLFVPPKTDTADSIIEQLRSAKNRKLGAFAVPSWFDTELMIQRRLSDHRANGFKFPEYQLEGIDYLIHRRGALLADDMGLGKTIQALMAIPDASKCGVVVIAPAGLQRNWFREVKKWRPDYEVFELSKATFRWPEKGQIVIAKWESLPAIKTLKRKPRYKMLGVVDEAHRGKNPSTHRTKSARAILGKCDAVWLLTGTAMDNKPKDFFNVLKLAQLHKYVGGRQTVFCSSYFKFNSKGKCIGADKRAAVLSKLICKRRLKTEVATEIPKKSYARLWVEVSSPALSKAMKSLIKKVGGEAALLSKLTTEGMQASERANTYEIMGRIRREIATAKLPHVLSWIRDREEEGEPVVVTCCHREPILQLAERKGWGKIIGGMTSAAKDKVVQAFQDGKLKGIAISTAGSEGITLTRACNMLRIDRDYLPKTNRQWEDRICRFGQERRTLITDVYAADVKIDDVVEAMNRRKEKFQKGAGLL